MLLDREEERRQLLARFKQEAIGWSIAIVGIMCVCAAFKVVGELIGNQDMVTNAAYVAMPVAFTIPLILVSYVLCPVSARRRLDRVENYQNFVTAYNRYIAEPLERHAYIAYMAWVSHADIPFTRQELRDKFTRDGMPSFVRYANGEVVTWID